MMFYSFRVHSARAPLLRIISSIVSLLLCSACASELPITKSYDSNSIHAEAEPFTSDVQLAVSAGRADLEDRYPTTVLVTSDETPGISGEPGYCTGVLLERDLVLTAAHCMCLPAIKAARGVSINNASCAKNATVIRPTYEFEVKNNKKGQSGKERRLAGIKYHEIPGVAFLPEEFKFNIDDQGRIRGREGDFAIIRLQKHFDVRIEHQFPKREVEIGERITIVGFGNVQQHKAGAALRVIGENIVTGVRLLESEESSPGEGERVEFYFHRRKTGSHTEEGDSGGPCFREDESGRWLVGIMHSNVPDGKTSVMLSTFRSRRLIDALIARSRAETD